MYFEMNEKRTVIVIDNDGNRAEYENATFNKKITSTDENGHFVFWEITTEDGKKATFNCHEWDLYTVTCHKERNGYKA